MDILSYNKAVLSSNRLNKFIECGADTKTIVFVLPRIMNEGEQRLVVQFPYSGTITGLAAHCFVAGTSGDTEILVERCSSGNFSGVQSWESILNSPIVISEGQVASANAGVGLLVDGAVEEHDYLRLNVPSISEGSEGFTVQLTVKIFE